MELLWKDTRPDGGFRFNREKAIGVCCFVRIYHVFYDNFTLCRGSSYGVMTSCSINNFPGKEKLRNGDNNHESTFGLIER